MKNISPHISYNEATVSPTALRLKIDNTPNAEQLKAMELVANAIFEPAREHFGPIKINSFFRCEALNTVVGGSKTSGHKLGNSIDASRGDKVKNKELHDWIKANCKFDQLINEYDYQWIHFSFVATGNRNQCLIIK